MAKGRVNLTFVKRRMLDGPFSPRKPGENLPEAYKTFWNEWITSKPKPVHYIPQQGNWKRNPATGEVTPVQNIPLPLKMPKEAHQQLWGGESVVQGFKKKISFKRRLPFFWVPRLQQSVVFSEILNKYMSVVVTEHALNLINENYGFDHYILKTPACDLKSILGVKMKRMLLTALANKELDIQDPKKRDEVYDKYKHYLSNYTKEEIEWYGLTYGEAVAKLKNMEKQPIVPLKHQYRKNLINELLEEQDLRNSSDSENEQKTWLSKINPFSGRNS